jgi:hypothetical protein
MHSKLLGMDCATDTSETPFGVKYKVAEANGLRRQCRLVQVAYAQPDKRVKVPWRSF